MFKVPLQSRMCFLSCSYSCMFERHCVEWCMCKSLSLEGCFPLSLLIETLILRGGSVGMIWDITNSLNANPGPISSKHLCEVGACSLPRTYTETGLNSKLRVVSCLAVKLDTCDTLMQHFHIPNHLNRSFSNHSQKDIYHHSQNNMTIAAFQH